MNGLTAIIRGTWAKYGNDRSPSEESPFVPQLPVRSRTNDDSWYAGTPP